MNGVDRGVCPPTFTSSRRDRQASPKERPGVTFLTLVCHFARCKVQCAVVDTVQDARTFCSSRGPEFDDKTFKCLRFNEEQRLRSPWPSISY